MIPANAITLAKFFEGWSSTVYICPGGKPTIGYGHVCSINHPPITREQGEIYLIEDMQISLATTLRMCPELRGYENKLGAIIDFTFNLGAGNLRSSTLRRKINQKKWGEVKQELVRWVYGGGRILPGLVTRRKAEASFF